MKTFIEYIVKQLVDKPDEVQINEISGERTVVLELRVGDGDMGKVIGKRGQTANSLRTLLAAVAAKNGKRSVLEILEKDGMKATNSQYKNQAEETTTRKPISKLQANNEKYSPDDGWNNM